jgi:hypothetical protein
MEAQRGKKADDGVLLPQRHDRKILVRFERCSGCSIDSTPELNQAAFAGEFANAGAVYRSGSDSQNWR